MLRETKKWLWRMRFGFSGLFLWLRSGWPFVALWLLILVLAWFRGCELMHLWVILILGVCLSVAEMLNTAVERLCNEFHPHYGKGIKAVKDICSGAVGVAALALIVVGAWIVVRGGG